jgi:hypothetical protein
MALKNRALFFIFLLPTLSIGAVKKTILPEIQTKQSPFKIRFISSDGKFTYYQRSSGELILSTNYSATEVLKSDKFTQYNISADEQGKSLIIEQDDIYHKYLSMRHFKNIYTINVNGSSLKKVGEGISAKLHNKGAWLTYYDPYRKTISLKSTTKLAVSYSIKLNSHKNPYFVPQVAVINDDAMIFTDMNEKGEQALLKFSMVNKKTSILEKLGSPYQKIELCSNSKNTFISFFGIHDEVKGSEIHQYNNSVKDYDFKKPIYKSSSNDIGLVNCKYSMDELYFVQDVSTKESPLTSEVSSISLSDKKVTVLSDLSFVTRFIQVDKRLIIPYLGKFYLLKGKNDINQSDTLVPAKEN